MNKIVYTVCSANHLAYAKTMADSFIEQNKTYKVFICVVDRIDNRFDVSFFEPHTVVEVEQLVIPAFEKMSKQYSMIELNCAIKPFMALDIFKNYQPDVLLYLDTDIFIYQPLTAIEEALIKNDILLTPHYTTPINDDAELKERELLRSGLYNAGFIGMKKSDNTTAFLNWWADRMIDQCYYNFEEGLGVDQKWLDVVPLFFKGIYVFNNKGANVAYWNLHERILTKKEGTVFVNNTEPLLFLHISGYKFETPEILSRHQSRFQLTELPVLNELLTDYRNIVKANEYNKFINLICYFAKPKKKSTGIMATINKIIKPLGIKISNA